VDLAIAGSHLDTLRIRSLAEWDVLAFIYHHGTSLASAVQISRLLGYCRATVGAALDSLTSTGLVQRSRNSHGVRLYQFAVAAEGDFRRGSLEEMMKVAEERQTRLLIIGHMRRAAAGKELRGRGGLHLA
jgi:predicted transcriptional regulator